MQEKFVINFMSLTFFLTPFILFPFYRVRSRPFQPSDRDLERYNAEVCHLVMSFPPSTASNVDKVTESLLVFFTCRKSFLKCINQLILLPEVDGPHWAVCPAGLRDWGESGAGGGQMQQVQVRQGWCAFVRSWVGGGWWVFGAEPALSGGPGPHLQRPDWMLTVLSVALAAARASVPITPPPHTP